MPFLLIRGTFHVVGKSPDGDTLGFAAKKKSNWKKLKGRQPKFNMSGKGNITNLRLEAIDTLETHYRPGKGKEIHQPQPQADDATDFTLKAASIKNVVWGMKNGKRTRVTSADDGNKTEGYILVRTVERFGRAVAFVFQGNPGKPDGTSQFLDVKWLKQSINFKLAESGMAYPTYYDDMCRFIDLRDALTAASDRAAKAKKGVWKADKSRSLTLNNEKQLITTDVVLPKMFRRLTQYLRTRKNNEKFIEWLKKKREDVLILAPGMMGKKGTFDEVFFEKGKRIGMTVKPTEVIFKP